jgi:hypothetical protein
MRAALFSLLKIEPGEGPKVLLFALLAAVLQAGLAVGTGAADTLFLLHAGPARLPIVYILTPVMMLVYIPCYTYLTKKLGIRRLLQLTIGLLVGGGIAVAALLTAMRTSDTVWVMYVAKLYAALWFVAQYSVFWNFTDDYFDILDSKRLFPILSSGSAIGAMTGGMLLSLLAERVPTPSLFGVWSLLALGALPIALGIQRRYRPAALAEDEEEPRILDVFSTLGRAMCTSEYIRVLVFVGFMCFVTAATCEFQYMTLFSAGRSEAELTQLFGRLFMFVNAFNLMFGLLFFNRFVLRLGVPAMALLQPGAFLLTFVFLLVRPGFSSAMLGFFVYQGLMPAITYDTFNLLLNAVPANIKSHVRTFVDGLAEPGAVAVSGLFLLLAASALGTERISVIGIGLAGVYLVLVLVMRSHYTTAMVQNLRRGWLDLANPPEHLLTRLPEGDLEFLKSVAASDDRDEASAAIRILWLNDKRAAVTALLAFLRRGSEEDRSRLRPLVAQALDDPDPEVVGAVLEWLRTSHVRELGSTLAEELGARGLVPTGVIEPFAKSESPMERAAAAVALLNSWKIEEGVEGGEIVRQLLASASSASAGIRALGFSGRSQYAYAVAPFARHGEPDVRREAVTALRRLVSPDQHLLSADVIAAIRASTGDERLEAMEILARIGDPNAIPALLGSAGDFTPLERRRAEAIILQFGPESVPTLVSMLRNRACPFKGRTVAARALGKLAFPQLELLSMPLIRDEIAHAYRGVWRWSLLDRERPTPGMETLKQYYLDVRRDEVDFVLAILAVAGRLPNVELLAASLASDNRKERGDAIETIEQGLTRSVFRELLPLIDHRSPAEQTAFYVRHHAPESLSLMHLLHDALQGTWLECLIAAQALCDSGPEGTRLLRDQLGTLDPAIAAEAFGAITRNGSGDAVPTHVEKIHYLRRSSFFERLAIQEAHVVAKSAETRRYGAGEAIFSRGDFADALYCVLDGAVHLLDGARWSVLTAGQVFGEKGLRGEFLRPVDAISQGARVLTIANAPLLNEARNHPRIATVVFRNALGLAAHPA